MTRARRYYESVADDRNEWAANFHACMGCGSTGDWRGLQIHEICRKSHASKTWGNTANYLLLCAPCHEGPFATMPHAIQLAVKFVRDRQHYSLEDWRAIESGRGIRVTEQDVAGYVRILRNAA